MPIANVGKNICTVQLGGDVFMFFNEFMTAPTVMTLKDKKDGTQLFSTVSAEMPSSGTKWRALSFRRVFSQSVSASFPVRFVPLVLDTNLTGNEIRPFYEIISPSINMLNGSMGVLSFWSNMTGSTSDYSFSNVYKVEQDKISSLPSTLSVKRVLYNSIVLFNRYYVTGGTIYTGATTDSSWDIVPICLKPVVVATNDSDDPAFDFASGGGGSSGGFKVHNHSDSANGGFSFSCYHPGTSVPQKPWR